MRPMDRERSDTVAAPEVTGLDIGAVRADFPALRRKIGKHPLVYFDNAATSQKPQSVIDRLVTYYENENSNVHRGAHTLSREATAGYEEARETVRAYLNAPSAREIVFTRGTTESVNLVAASFARHTLVTGDEILVSAMEHHSNLVPWQMVCEKTGAKLIVAPVHESGELDREAYECLLTDRTRMVALCHVSNTLGTVNPVKDLIRSAKKRDALVLLDGAQAAAHLHLDVQDLDCDFYCMSGHKMFGPTGIGALYARASVADRMQPYQGGGEMIQSVSFAKTTYAEPPYRFEAGTPNIAGAIAYAEAIRYVQSTGLDRIAESEHLLLRHGTAALEGVDGLRLIGTAREKVPVFSFLVDGVHPLDLGAMLDAKGFAVRTGHHCTEPLMDLLGIPGTVRASLSFYNTTEEIDRFADALNDLIPKLR